MGMTITQKILANHCGCETVSAGDLIDAKLDLVLGSDVTTPIAIKEMEKFQLDRVWNKDKIVLVMDHFTPNKDIQAARNCAYVREFAQKHGINHFYEGGKMGIEHALLPELGLIAPGELIVGADSHTCTYGALGAFSTGIGSTDMAAGMVLGRCWFKVPSAISVNLIGELNPFVSGKDIILHLIGLIGVDGARYKSIEFTGESVSLLSMDDRFAICNMVIEAGAKNGVFPVDNITIKYLKDKVNRKFTVMEAVSDAEYNEYITIDLNELYPLVAAPHLPSNVKQIDSLKDLKIQQAIIGSCANGRIGDLRVAADILKGKKVNDDVRCIIIPATPKIYLQAIEEGLAKTFIEAGCIVSMPTCGPCNGGHLGVLADGERCISTTNRNFVGRMGATSSEIFLANPAVVAASAIAGFITMPRK